MRGALCLGRTGEGRTWPNPSVGCLVVRGGRLVGCGRTSDGGRPHAETVALKMAGDEAEGATAYVTLEPCSHHGKTRPCVDALVESKVRRVVVGAHDPDERVSGQGIARLKQAGLEVSMEGLGDSIKDFYRAYSWHRRTGAPFVTAKIASTIDGKIALADGRSKWITGARTRHYVHLLRSEHDAILTSSGTVRADDPTLTARLEGYDGPQPLRIVASREMTLDDESNLAQSVKNGRVILMGLRGGDSLPDGVEAIAVAEDDQGRPDCKDILQKLGAMGVTSVLVEAGGQFLSSLLKADLIDRLVWTRSSSVIGGEGRPSLADLGLGSLEDGAIFKRISLTQIEDDAVESYTNKKHI